MFAVAASFTEAYTVEVIADPVAKSRELLAHSLGWQRESGRCEASAALLVAVAVTAEVEPFRELVIGLRRVCSGEAKAVAKEPSVSAVKAFADFIKIRIGKSTVQQHRFYEGLEQFILIV